MSWRRHIMATLTSTDISSIELNLRNVLDRIRVAYESAPVQNRSSTIPRLVAVTKTKPPSAIVAAYRFGQRHFGENYVQELIEKANDPSIVSECVDIRWHFIGHLQSNKITKLVERVPKLYAVETVDSEKCARMLNDSVTRKFGEPMRENILKVFIEVNTSGEDQKSGVQSEEAVRLANFIKNSCPALQFVGFMTIGALSDQPKEINPDFVTLVETRRAFCKEYSIEDEKTIELSMGMSTDFENAVKTGSTNVRIGSTIFGAREAKKP